MEEIWVDIRGYEGKYQVSNLGQIKSLNYNRTGKPRIMLPHEGKDGALSVQLCKDGAIKMFRLHRLVGDAFIPNPTNSPEINHKDENPKNNSVSNLEWCDRVYNNNYGTRTARASAALSKPVVQLFEGKFVAVYRSAREASQKTEINYKSIRKCCRGERKTAGGYEWKD
jgi:hypothetical protein